ncbi:hypothetical protein H0185_10535 [Mesobacillus maritimus]|uniref:Uncharacterized protein n=1 Tax=Mesobacillus maritimus TaxID=1643336 RepID=A0ABS7K4V0_9BACI|nr:hypothetical protein [Mesobacillus maritimus]
MGYVNAIPDDIRSVQFAFCKHSKGRRLVTCAFLACMATILQAAGGFLPGIGYMISPFATLPILIGAMFALRMGVLSYSLTTLLLLILVPSELFIFPFTTGLLGIGIGAAFSLFNKKSSIIVTGASFLTVGIMSLLYLFHYPVLGPVLSGSFSFRASVGIFLFSFFYSWIWVEIGLFFFIKLKSIFA